MKPGSLTSVSIPGLRTKSPNHRELWQARTARVKSERKTTTAYLKFAKKPELPCSVILTRVAPSGGLDDDNLSGSFKGVRDAVAEWLGVDDRDRFRVRYRYKQKTGPYGVEIEFGPPAKGAQLEIGLHGAVDDDEEETPF